MDNLKDLVSSQLDANGGKVDWVHVAKELGVRGNSPSYVSIYSHDSRRTALLLIACVTEFLVSVILGTPHLTRNSPMRLSVMVSTTGVSVHIFSCIINIKHIGHSVYSCQIRLRRRNLRSMSRAIPSNFRSFSQARSLVGRRSNSPQCCCCSLRELLDRSRGLHTRAHE